MILMWKRHDNCTVWKKKCEELKEELTAVQIQLSEIQGFTDKQKAKTAFCDT